MVIAVSTESTQSAGSGPPPGAQPPRVQNRRSDDARTVFRGSRYFTVGHEWYFMLREGGTLGPFSERGEAELAGAQHVAEYCLMSSGGIAKLFDHDEDGITEFELMVREMLDCLEQRKLRSENSAFVWTRQRVDELLQKPEKQRHTHTRIKALEYLLDQWED